MIFMAKLLLNTCMFGCLALYLSFTSFLILDSGNMSRLFSPIFAQTKNIPEKIYSRQVNGNYQWKKLINDAAFPKSYNFQLFSHNDTLWAFHSAGNWYSVDGKTWRKSALQNVLHNLAFLDYVYFKNAVLALGQFDGNIEKYRLTTSIHRTKDFKNWELLSTESNLPKRFFYHPFVFNNKIWIIGGSDGNEEYNDAWSSEDGVHWKKQADNLPFGRRANQQFVVFKNKIFMLDSEVWTSVDGINWNRLTPQIVREKIFGYATVVYDNRIWLLGCNRNGQFTSKVLTSEDGKTWAEQDAPWSARGGIAACTHKGKIYMTGGKYGGTPNQPEFIYSNDVWSLGMFQ